MNKIMVSLLVCCALAGMASAQTPDGDLHILVTGFDDVGNLGLTLNDVLASWLESMFEDMGYINISTVEESFSLDEAGMIEAVAAATENGADLVMFGAFVEENGRIKMGMVAVVSTDGPYKYYSSEILFEDEGSFSYDELAPGSPAPDRFRVFCGSVAANCLFLSDMTEESQEVMLTALSGTENVEGSLLVEAYRTLGLISSELNDHSTAIDAYTQAIALTPEDPQLWSLRGSAYDAIGNYTNAARNFEEAIRLDQDNAAYVAQLGAQLCQAGRFREALEYLDISLEMIPSNAMYYRDRSRAYYGIGDMEAALEDVDRSLELDPGSSQGHALRGILLWGLEEADSAFVSFSRAAELERDPIVRAWSLMGMGNCMMVEEDWSAAVEYLNATLQCNPDFHTAYFCLGKCHFRLGDMDTAAQCLEEFLRHPVMTSHTDPWTRLGMKTEAEEMLEVILSDSGE